MLRKLGCCLLFPLAALALPGGHSHNDYEQNKPFDLAARSGMISIEADVFPEGGRLLVAHSRTGLDPTRSLRKLYLEPLQHWKKPLELLVDIKSDPDLTLELLEQELQATPLPRQVLVVLSGSRPTVPPKSGCISLEGTLTELRSGKLPTNCQFVSGPWWGESGWRGQGPMPTSTREHLEELVKQVHAKGLLLRIWGSPDTPEAWEAFYRLGIDRINTDHPKELGDWLKQKESH